MLHSNSQKHALADVCQIRINSYIVVLFVEKAKKYFTKSLTVCQTQRNPKPPFYAVAVSLRLGDTKQKKKILKTLLDPACVHSNLNNILPLVFALMQ